MEQSILMQAGMKEGLREMAEVAGYLWERGWAERNAGNISVNVTEMAGWRERKLVNDQAGGLEKQLLLVSASGCRMRELAINPEKHVCVLALNTDGQAAVLSDDNGRLKPSSELATHLEVHQMLMKKNAPEKVLLHAHVTELIALTHIAKFTEEEAINHMLRRMHPETGLFIPEGVGFIPFAIPGSKEIAALTREKFETHKVVIWEKHGCLAIGTSVAEAFDLLDILAKSASIWFSCKASGIEAQGLSEEQLEAIADKQ